MSATACHASANIATEPVSTAALVAEAVGAEALVLLTDVTAVSSDIDDPAAPMLSSISAPAMRRLTFAAGSMGPKVDAACRFVERTGRIAAIGALDEVVAVLAGRAGTRITPTEEQGAG